MESLVRQLLFIAESGEPLFFSTQQCARPDHLDKLIQENGGEVTEEDGPHTIHLVSQGEEEGISSSTPSLNTFRCAYITECVRVCELLPLKNYWAHKATNFDDQFDPYDVMMGSLTWAECTLPETHGPEESAEEQPHAMDLDDELFFKDDLPSTSQRWKTRGPRAPYTHNERKAILKFIVEGRRYSEVKGANLWKTMELRKVCPSRSWQSMKQHFRTYILDHLDQFSFPNIDLAAKFSSNQNCPHSPVKPRPLRRPAVVYSDEEEVEKNTDIPQASREEEGNDNRLQASRHEEEEKDNNDVPQSSRQEEEEEGNTKLPETYREEEEDDNIALPLSSRGEEEEEGNNNDMPQALRQEGSNDRLQASKQEEEEDNDDTQLSEASREEEGEDNDVTYLPEPSREGEQEDNPALPLSSRGGEEEEEEDNNNTDLPRSAKDKEEKEDNPHTPASLRGEDKEEGSNGLPQTSEEEEEEEEDDNNNNDMSQASRLEENSDDFPRASRKGDEDIDGASDLPQASTKEKEKRIDNGGLGPESLISQAEKKEKQSKPSQPSLSKSPDCSSTVKSPNAENVKQATERGVRGSHQRPAVGESQPFSVDHIVLRATEDDSESAQGSRLVEARARNTQQEPDSSIDILPDMETEEEQGSHPVVSAECSLPLKECEVALNESSEINDVLPTSHERALQTQTDNQQTQAGRDHQPNSWEDIESDSGKSVKSFILFSDFVAEEKKFGDDEVDSDDLPDINCEGSSEVSKVLKCSLTPTSPSDIPGRHEKEKAVNPEEEGHAAPTTQHKSRRKISPSRSSSESPVRSDTFHLKQQRHRLKKRLLRKRRRVSLEEEEDRDDEEPVVERYVPKRIPSMLPSKKLDNLPEHRQLWRAIDGNPKEITENQENQMDGLSSQSFSMNTRSHQCCQGYSGPSKRNKRAFQPSKNYPVASSSLQRHQTASSPSMRQQKAVSSQNPTLGNETSSEEEEEEEEEGLRGERGGGRTTAGRPSSSSDSEDSSSRMSRTRKTITTLKASNKSKSYSLAEDLDIICYIEENRGYNRLGGRQFWQEMAINLGNKRTWQSLKERFRKRIMNNLHLYLRHGMSEETRDRLNNRVSMKIEVKNEQEKKPRQFFTHGEDLCILRFIIDNCRYSEVGGTVLWQDMMASERKLRKHTWQSLKQRHNKVIVRKLELYGLSQDEMLKLRGKQKSSHRGQPQRTVTSGRGGLYEEHCSSDSNDSDSERTKSPRRGGRRERVQGECSGLRGVRRENNNSRERCEEERTEAGTRRGRERHQVWQNTYSRKSRRALDSSLEEEDRAHRRRIEARQIMAHSDSSESSESSEEEEEKRKRRGSKNLTKTKSSHSIHTAASTSTSWSRLRPPATPPPPPPPPSKPHRNTPQATALPAPTKKRRLLQPDEAICLPLSTPFNRNSTNLRQNLEIRRKERSVLDDQKQDKAARVKKSHRFMTVREELEESPESQEGTYSGRRSIAQERKGRPSTKTNPVSSRRGDDNPRLQQREEDSSSEWERESQSGISKTPQRRSKPGRKTQEEEEDDEEEADSYRSESERDTSPAHQERSVAGRRSQRGEEEEEEEEEEESCKSEAQMNAIKNSLGKDRKGRSNEETEEDVTDESPQSTRKGTAARGRIKKSKKGQGTSGFDLHSREQQYSGTDFLTPEHSLRSSPRSRRKESSLRRILVQSHTTTTTSSIDVEKTSSPEERKTQKKGRKIGTWQQHTIGSSVASNTRARHISKHTPRASLRRRVVRRH